MIGPAPIDRVLYDVFRGRPLPGVGLAVQKPTWTTLPAGAWAATVDADATTAQGRHRPERRHDRALGLGDRDLLRRRQALEPGRDRRRSTPPPSRTSTTTSRPRSPTLLDTTAGTAERGDQARRRHRRLLRPLRPRARGHHRRPGRLGPARRRRRAQRPVGVAGPTSSPARAACAPSYAGVPDRRLRRARRRHEVPATRRALDVRITEPVQLTANAIGALNVELGVVGEGALRRRRRARGRWSSPPAPRSLFERRRGSRPYDAS